MAARWCFLAALVLAAAVEGQIAPAAPERRPVGTGAWVSGRVVQPGRESVTGVAGAWVTLHRVGTDRAGPLDSVRTDRIGRYAFRYERTGAGDAIYFVSSSHDGIAYFTLPLRSWDARGDDALITVFDTTSRPVRIAARGHHAVLERPDSAGERRVTEVFELSNDTSVTRVARDESAAGAVWSAALASGARDARVRGGDIAGSAVRFSGERVLVYAPFAPGVKQLVFSYTVPDRAFPLAIPVGTATQVVEVLLEEPRARVTGAGLRAVQPVAIEGRPFRRFLAADVPQAAVLTVSVPETARPLAPWVLAVLTLAIGGAMTLALARALRRR